MPYKEVQPKMLERQGRGRDLDAVTVKEKAGAVRMR